MALRRFSDFDSHLGKRDSRKLQNNTYVQRRDVDTIAVRLHSTDVLTFTRKGLVRFNTGGWQTKTTKDRLNAYAPHGWSVDSERGEWVLQGIRTDGVRDRWTFRDGITVDTVKGGIVRRSIVADGRPRVSRATPTADALYAWHFIGSNRMTAHAGAVQVKEGQTLTVKGPIEACSRGLHASETPSEALQYHKGPILCRVQVWGDMVRARDKVAARFRRVVKMLDVSDIIERCHYYREGDESFDVAINERFGL